MPDNISKRILLVTIKFFILHILNHIYIFRHRRKYLAGIKFSGYIDKKQYSFVKKIHSTVMKWGFCLICETFTKEVSIIQFSLFNSNKPLSKESSCKTKQIIMKLDLILDSRIIYVCTLIFYVTQDDLTNNIFFFLLIYQENFIINCWITTFFFLILKFYWY